MNCLKQFYPFLLSCLYFLILPLTHNQAFAASGFNIVSSSNPSTTENYLQAVSASDATHAWAVGTDADADNMFHALIEYSNGSSWGQQTVVNVTGAIDSYLTGVKAFNSSDVWAVGCYMDSDYNEHVLIEKTEDGGESWVQDTNSYTGGGCLYAIDGDPSSGDAWAVGNDASGNALTLQLVNGHFTSQTNVSPNANVQLTSVSEHSSTDIWAVGYSGNNTFTMHYDGSNWTPNTSPNPASSNVFDGVTAISSTNAWAVGFGDDTSYLFHWDGSAWSQASSGDNYNALYAITATSANNIWAAGANYNTTDGLWRPYLLHSSDGGSTWAPVAAEAPSNDHDARLFGIATTAGKLWTVGSNSYTSNNTYKTDTLTEQLIPKTPLIFIPGVMGSKLAVTGSQAIGDITTQTALNPLDPDSSCINTGHYSYNQGDLVWIDESMSLLDALNKYVYPCRNYLDVLQFDSSGQPVYSQVGLSGDIIHKAYNDGTTNTAIPYLVQQGYTPGVDLFIYPYDWRKDVSTTVSDLTSLINNATANAGTTQVDMMAHSMGGLVAREYIRDTTRASKVHTLVELGVPHAGSPKSLAQLLYNTCPYTAAEFSFSFCLPNPQEANKLVQNFPGTFDLLPSRLYYTLYPNLYPYSDSFAVDNMLGPLNYDQLKSLLSYNSSAFNKNMTVFDIADQLHNSDSSHTGLDDTYSNTNGVTTYLIAGSGFPTFGQLYDYISTTSGEIKQDAIATNGDDTVPLLSATIGQTSNVYYTNQRHGGVITGAGLAMAVNLLNGNTNIVSGIQTTPFNFSGTILSVHSPTLLDAYDDQGHHTGSSSAGFIEEGIPGSTYDQLGSSKFIYLPSGGTYHFSTRPVSAGSFDLKVTTYSISAPTQELIYRNVPQTAQTTSSMSLANNNTTLSLDVNGDGTNVQSVSPTYNLTGDAASDYAPPFTVATLSPTASSDGTFSNPVTVTLSSTASAGFSVSNTYYTIDNGSQQTYSTPFTVSGGGSHTITYWSVDNAGLTESDNTRTFTIVSYNDDVLNDGAIGYWTLSNAVGSNSGLTDLTTTANNMTETDVTHGAAKINTSAAYSDSYNGTSSSTFASSIGMTLYTATSNFSLEAWVKPTALPTLYNLAGVLVKNSTYGLAFDGPKPSFFIRRSGSNTYCDASNDATTGTIYHLVGTYDGSSIKLYVNGSLACSMSATGATDMSSGGLITGSWDTSVLFMQGYISNVAIYNNVLSATQVSTHYNDGKL
jgi:Concanavalin A-like lectin/glucanases superfamily/Lecithin:cholesterol acyltransferase